MNEPRVDFQRDSHTFSRNELSTAKHYIAVFRATLDRMFVYRMRLHVDDAASKRKKEKTAHLRADDGDDEKRNNKNIENQFCFFFGCSTLIAVSRR